MSSRPFVSPLSLALWVPIAVAAACVVGACSMDRTPLHEGPSGKASTHNNPPLPSGGEASDQPPGFKRTDYLNDPKKLFAGLHPADFSGEHITGYGAISLRDYDTPVKDQGSRGWCTAFAQVGAVENLVKHTYGDVVDLSEEDHWSHYEEYDIDASAGAAKSTMITPESSWPYFGSPISGYESTAIAKLTSYKELPTRDAIATALKAGHPVVMGLMVNDSWESVGSDGHVYPGGGALGGHAVLVVGLIDDASYGGGGYLLIKNSWSSKWGDRGYAHAPYDWCESDDCYFLEMQGVDYKGHAPAPPPPAPDAGPGPGPDPDAGPAPTPDPDSGPAPDPGPGPGPSPGGEPTADDIDVVAEYDPSQPGHFKVKLYGHHAGDLAQVSDVYYDIDESFGLWEYWWTDDPTDDYAVPFWYNTWAHHWQTNGAVVTLKSGTVLYLAGAPIDW